MGSGSHSGSHSEWTGHVPVMADEVATLLGGAPEGLIVDATVGGGGHSERVLEGDPSRRLVGLDRDPVAIAAARARLVRFGDRADLVLANFSNLARVLTSRGSAAVAGVLVDLGVSSHQFDVPERGFSYRTDARLDMRMDPTAARSAWDVVNATTSAELVRILQRGGEDRFASRIAGAIVRSRPLDTTSELSEAVVGAIPAAARRGGGHPAKRSFQAIRIEVNGELDALRAVLDQAAALLVPGGRLVVLSYHSGEDRIVKSFMLRQETGGCTCPPDLPCACGAEPLLRRLARSALRPSAAETALNRRAASARLRAAARLGTVPTKPDTSSRSDLP